MRGVLRVSGKRASTRPRSSRFIDARNSLPLAVQCIGTWLPTAKNSRKGSDVSTRSI
ncbi:hypothetical protein D3C72_1076940 [compost metagenome]